MSELNDRDGKTFRSVYAKIGYDNAKALGIKDCRDDKKCDQARAKAKEQAEAEAILQIKSEIAVLSSDAPAGRGENLTRELKQLEHDLLMAEQIVNDKQKMLDLLLADRPDARILSEPLPPQRGYFYLKAVVLGGVFSFLLFIPLSVIVEQLLQTDFSRPVLRDFALLLSLAIGLGLAVFPISLASRLRGYWRSAFTILGVIALSALTVQRFASLQKEELLSDSGWRHIWLKSTWVPITIVGIELVVLGIMYINEHALYYEYDEYREAHEKWMTNDRDDAERFRLRTKDVAEANSKLQKKSEEYSKAKAELQEIMDKQKQIEKESETLDSYVLRSANEALLAFDVKLADLRS